MNFVKFSSLNYQLLQNSCSENKCIKEMKLVTKFLLLAFAGIVVVSCMENETSDIVEKTEAMELEELSVYLDTLEQRGVDIDTTEIGVYYVVDSLGEGPFPHTADTCIVQYEGYTLSGYLFDASALHSEDGNYEFVLENPPMITGWDNGMKHINEGSVVYLIIPSEFAYGSNGVYPAIGPYETLIFAIEMVEIKQAY